eukprot:TRINITY_DN3426_c0_g1_i4.p1 TRINITY_DN3426_c0_g1~~TRINITY_DN3426_c0_g1_i4.p1  ORF type:complete len:1030 (+),score=184.59 TRINITY_DN3426_c0_g1_i4:396-3092(+)
MDNYRSTVAVDFSSPVEGTDAYYLTAMSSEESVQRVANGEDWAGHIEGVHSGMYVPMILGRKDDPNAPRYCVRAASDVFVSRAYAIPLRPGQDPLVAGCSTFKMYPPGSDYVLGQIQVYSPSGPALCAAYNGDVLMRSSNDPQFNDPSQISVQTCETSVNGSNWQRQQFWLHRVMGHIKWARTIMSPYFNQSNPRYQPAVSMWWSGPLRMNGVCDGNNLADCVDTTNPNHRWIVPTKYFAPIISNDPRGFSGRCWSVTGEYIDAQQRCSLFLFKAHTQIDNGGHLVPFTYTPPLPVSRAVVLQALINKVIYCLAIVRVSVPVALKTARRDFQTVSMYKLRAQSCDKFGLANRFVMSHPAERNCTELQSCNVHLRWSADSQNGLLYPRGDGTVSTSAVKESELPDTWNIVFHNWSTIQLTKLKDKCWGLDSNLEVIMTSNLANCASFRVLTMPAADPNVTVVEEFNGWSNIVRASDEKYELLLANNTINTTTYQQVSSVFFGDLGVSGSRNFMMRNAWVMPTFISVRWGGGLSFPFVPHPLIDNSPFGLISVEFSKSNFGCTVDCQITRAGQSYLLFSFESMTGCDVYITQGGHLGMRCSINDRASVCQARFQSASLVDLKFHTVSLVYSTQKEYPHRLYVDGQLVMTCELQDDWSIVLAAPRLSVISQPAQWKYISFDGIVRRVAVRVGSYMDLRRTARFLVGPGVKPDAFNATKLAAFETSWENCTAVLRDDRYVETINCVLVVTRHGMPYVVPRDVFSLGCARPTCQIFFSANETLVGSRFSFTYRPNFPMGFDAKNIGDPGQFQDYALVTDGFGYGHIRAMVHYAPQDSSKLETSAESSASVKSSNVLGNHMDSESKTLLTDFIRYELRESCCGQAERVKDFIDEGEHRLNQDIF